MQIQFVVNTSRASIITGLIAVLLFSLCFAALVRWMRKRDSNHGYTAVLVVIGVAAVIVAFASITSVQLGLVLSALFALAGMPMVAEYTDYRLMMAEHARQERLLDAITGGNQDGVSAQNGRISLAQHRGRRPE